MRIRKRRKAASDKHLRFSTFIWSSKIVDQKPEHMALITIERIIPAPVQSSLLLNNSTNEVTVDNDDSTCSVRTNQSHMIPQNELQERFSSNADDDSQNNNNTDNMWGIWQQNHITLQTIDFVFIFIV